MTEQTWKYWTPERDGHAPDDWVEGLEVELEYSASDWRACPNKKPFWSLLKQYRYRPLQDATYEPDLLAQCLALPQDQREALIEAMQKPQRDWADDVWEKALKADGYAFPVVYASSDAAAVIRSMCRPKEVEIDEAKIDEDWSRLFSALQNSAADAKSVFRQAIREALA